MRNALRVAVGIVVASCLALPATAQEASGSISGQAVITDSSDPYVVPVKVYDDTGTLVKEVISAMRDWYVDGLSPGTYKVQVGDRWFSSASSFDEADPVIVTAGADTPGIKVNFTAAEFGWIEGRVFDSVTNDAVCATVLAKGAGIRPDDGGNYRLGLSPGQWKINFVDNCDFMYGDQWWSNRATEDEADAIEAIAGATVTGVDAAMVKPEDMGGWISGTVTDAETGQAIPGVCVIPYGANGEVPPLPINASRPPTTDDGTYRLGFLGEGDFRLEFADCRYFAYETRFWRMSSDLAGADTITVPLGWEVGGVDVALDLRPGSSRPDLEPPSSPAELPFTGTAEAGLLLAALAGSFVLGGSVLVLRAGREN